MMLEPGDNNCLCMPCLSFLAFKPTFTTPQADYCMRIDNHWTCDAIEQANNDDGSFRACFINHSRRRWNVRRRVHRREQRIYLFAARNIEASAAQVFLFYSQCHLTFCTMRSSDVTQENEELLLDYGRQFWLGREQRELR